MATTELIQSYTVLFASRLKGQPKKGTAVGLRLPGFPDLDDGSVVGLEGLPDIVGQASVTIVAIQQSPFASHGQDLACCVVCQHLPRHWATQRTHP